MHAFPRTAPVPRPRVGERAAGAVAMPIEPFDWAVEEPDWAGTQSGPDAVTPDWWLRDRPILANPATPDAPATVASAAEASQAGPPSSGALGDSPAAATRGPHAHKEAGAITPAREGDRRVADQWEAGRWSVARGAGDPGVRLTRRGRLVVVALAAAVLLGAFWIGTRAVSAASTTAGTEVAYVQNGDTLWAVAERVRPGVDPRDTVARIRDLNGLDGTLIQPGQRLVLPAR